MDLKVICIVKSSSVANRIYLVFHQFANAILEQTNTVESIGSPVEYEGICGSETVFITKIDKDGLRCKALLPPTKPQWLKLGLHYAPRTWWKRYQHKDTSRARMKLGRKD